MTPRTYVHVITITAIVIVIAITMNVVASRNSITYLDNNGTTKIFPESLAMMDNVYLNHYGNASAIYTFGADSKTILEACRKKVAGLLNCEACEVYFTSGATESNNIAIRGVYSKHREKGKHVIMTSVEHPSVDETVKTLDGADITVLPVDKYGKINLQDLENAIRKDTVLVTVIMGNNEVGTIQDVRSISEVCARKKVHFHCDMTQVVGKYVVDLKELGIDSATGSGHKFHGPKATGILFLKKGTYFESCMSGGHQEKNIRSGTENIPGIVGMCYSLYLCDRHIRSGKPTKIKEMRDWMSRALVSKLPGTIVNGHPSDSLYNTLSLCLPTNSRKLVMMLDKSGICISTGSACSKGSSSRVLDAMGIDKELQDGSVRISLGFLSTWSDCRYAVDRIISCSKAMKLAEQ